jgi:hypothetical protein
MLSKNDLQKLDAVSKPVPEYPEWMPEFTAGKER